MKKTLTSRFALTLASVVLILSLSLLASKLEFSSIGETEVQAYMPSGVPFPSCLDNYETWHSSTSFKTNSDWDVRFIVGYKGTMERMIDINGDGLVDYLYAYNDNPTYSHNCVYLNNGSGWNPVYKCVVRSSVYYGDCAA